MGALLGSQALSLGGGGAGGWSLVNAILVPLSLAALVLLLFAGRRQPASA